MKNIIVLLVLLLSACSSFDYEVGDISKIYCASTNSELRAFIKSDLELNNIKVGINYCAAFGLVDAMANL